MGIALNDEIRRLLDGRRYAVLSDPQPRRLERDPRASVSVLDSDDPRTTSSCAAA